MLCNIVGIDPGNNTGICRIEYNPIDGQIVNITTEFICLENMINPYSLDKARDKVIAAQTVGNYIMYNYNPICVGLESAFMNTRFPRAVIQLSQYVGMLESTLINTNRFIKIFKYPPKLIKSNMGSGDNKKQDMTDAVINHPELSKYISNISILTEHEIDAICIAYCVIQDIRKYPLVTVAL